MFHAKKQLITTHGAAGEFENVLSPKKTRNYSSPYISDN